MQNTRAENPWRIAYRVMIIFWSPILTQLGLHMYIYYISLVYLIIAHAMIHTLIICRLHYLLLYRSSIFRLTEIIAHYFNRRHSEVWVTDNEFIKIWLPGHNVKCELELSQCPWNNKRLCVKWMVSFIHVFETTLNIFGIISAN